MKAALMITSELESLKPECQICGKTFNSLKALHGHMRSHPNRSWKGIQPPSTSPCSSTAPPPSSSSSSSVLSRSLPRWSVTAPRGRKATAAASSSSSSTPSEIAAANSDERRTMYLIPPTKKLFKCNSFSKRFSSHQALGSHKSSHEKTLSIANVTGTTTSTTTSFDAETGLRRRILDFDLNELPPIEDDREDLKTEHNHSTG